MARFITRVELHNANYSDYETLHKAMEAEGFSRLIQESDGTWYYLPTAEYYRICTLTLQQVLDSAERAASKTQRKYGVILSETTSSTWNGLLMVK